MTIGIIGAMPEEINALADNMVIEHSKIIASRTFLQGKLYGVDVVLVLSRVGKVSAAITACMLVAHFAVDKIIFIGVGGGADPALNVGDVVIASGVMHHDLDASPLFPKYEVPLLGVSIFYPDPYLLDITTAAVNYYLNEQMEREIGTEVLRKFAIVKPKLALGVIASGDQFINHPDTLSGIKTAIEQVSPSALKCVEMEGAAVAQACHELGVRFVIIRTLSDKADHSAHLDFGQFIASIASTYSNGIIRELFTRHPEIAR